MFRLPTEQSLLAAFRPRDRRHLELPKGLTYPLFVRHALSWADPSGFAVNVVFAVPKGAPTGIAFRRDQRGGDAGVSRMCEWCHSTGGADAISLLTTDVNSKRRVGISLCVDLSCAAKLEDAANRSGRSAVDASAQLLARMGRFAQESLKIDPSGAGRD